MVSFSPRYVDRFSSKRTALKADVLYVTRKWTDFEVRGSFTGWGSEGVNVILTAYMHCSNRTRHLPPAGSESGLKGTATLSRHQQQQNQKQGRLLAFKNKVQTQKHLKER